MTLARFCISKAIPISCCCGLVTEYPVGDNVSLNGVGLEDLLEEVGLWGRRP